jgi:hypothetical protein
MAYTTIDDPSAHFHTQLYTGNGSSGLSITNDANAGNFQPDFLWIKARSITDNNVVLDSSRTSEKRLKTNSDDAEDSNDPALITFETDGFDLDTTDAAFNQSSATYVAWQWKMNGGSTTAGGGDDTAATSTHQANTTAKQSIVTYTGTGSSMTVAHGLGKVPEYILIKKRTDDSESWRVFHQLGYKGGAYGQMQSGGKLDTSDTFDHGANSYWDNTVPTSTVFTVKDNATVNDNTDTYVAYCWSGVQGYSKFGGYGGNSNSNGAFIHLGFKPAYVLIRNVSAGQSWWIFDNKRTLYTGTDVRLRADRNTTEDTGSKIDFVSNGFKWRDGDNAYNYTGNNFIYAAFAEQPFVTSSGVPCTAE